MIAAQWQRSAWRRTCPPDISQTRRQILEPNLFGCRLECNNVVHNITRMFQACVNPLTPTVAIWLQRVKPSFVIFDIRTLWLRAVSVRVSGCQKLQTAAGLARDACCAQMATVGVKGLKHWVDNLPQSNIAIENYSSAGGRPTCFYCARRVSAFCADYTVCLSVCHTQVLCQNG